MPIIKMSNTKNRKDSPDVLILAPGAVDGVSDGDSLTSNEGDVCTCSNNFTLPVADATALDISFGTVFGAGAAAFGAEEAVFDATEAVFEAEGASFDAEAAVLDSGAASFDTEANAVADAGIVSEAGADATRGAGSADTLEFEDNDPEAVDGNGEDDCDDECVIANAGT